MSAHTPGPWHLSSPYRISAEAGHAGIHGAFQTAVAVVDGEGPMAMANARLIAVVPELAEALRNAHDALGMNQFERESCRRRIRDVLAKAGL